MRSRSSLVALCAVLLAATASASVVRAVDLETLSRRADAIVQGVAGETTSAFSADGKQIHSVTLVRVLSRIKGEGPATVEVRTPGGVVGEIGQKVWGAPSFAPGEEVIVFLRRQGPKHFAVEGLSLGKFTVRRDPDGIRRVGQEPKGLEVMGRDGKIQRAAGLSPLDEAEFLARVRRALASGGTP